MEHDVCENESDLRKYAGSKYVQSDISAAYKKIESCITSKKVLFIGVPCQVYAVKEYFQNIENRENIYYVDLLCRGGCSSRCLREHIRSVSGGRHVEEISFRGGKYNCWFVTYDKDKRVIYRGPQYIDPYFAMFMRHSMLQERCYECPFAGKERIGDITIGDFWGLNEKILPDQQKMGMNMVLVNSERGRGMLDMVRNSMKLVTRPCEEAVCGNSTLRQPTEMPVEHYKLLQRIRVVGFTLGMSVYGMAFYMRRVFKCRLITILQDIKARINNVKIISII